MAGTEDVTLDGDMAPSQSPGGGRRFAGVRRVNNLPIWIIGGIALAFVLVALTIAIQRSQRAGVEQSAEVATQRQSDAARAANSIVPKVAGGIAPVTTPPPGPLGPPVVGGPLGSVDAMGVPVATPGGGNIPPPPPPPGSYGPNATPAPTASKPPPSPAQLARERRREARLAQFEAAVSAPSRVNQISARSAGSAPSASGSRAPADLDALRAQLAASQGQGDVTAAVAEAQLADLERSIGAGITGGGGGAGPTAADGGGGASANNGSRNSYSQFAARAGDDRWRSSSTMQAPRSPFELRTGFVLPATLISGINSDLPGQIVAQVSQNVYDTPTGKFLLVPQGARLVGSYSADVAYGQSRVLVAWQRIIFPDGKALDLGSMPGADGGGYAGLKDKVNTHFLRVLTQAVLLSGVTAGISLSQPQNTISDDGQLTGQSALTQALGQNLGQVTVEILRKNLNVSPTLVIRPGFRFNVVVVKDLTFSKPYRGFDY